MFARVQKCGTVELEHEQEEEVLREERKAVGCVWLVNRRVCGGARPQRGGMVRRVKGVNRSN